MKICDNCNARADDDGVVLTETEIYISDSHIFKFDLCTRCQWAVVDVLQAGVKVSDDDPS